MNVSYLVILSILLFAHTLIFTSGFFSIRRSATSDFLLCVLPIFLLTLILVGFRPLDAGFDTALYVNTYLLLSDFFSARATGTYTFGNTELLWWPLQAIFRLVFDAREWLVCNCVLVFSLVALSYKITSRHTEVNPWIFPFVFLTFYLVYSGNAMRQAIAVPLCFLATVSYYKINRVLFGFVLAIAVGLHWSSGLFALVPILERISKISPRITIMMPFFLALLSPVFGFVFGAAINLLGMDELASKHDLYFSADRESHVGAVWKTVNFWICTTIPFLYIRFCREKFSFDDPVTSYSTLVLSMILFGMSIPDFSERLFPAMLLILPILVYRLINTTNLSASIKSFLFTCFFISIGFSVLFTESAQTTLSYDLFF